MPWISQRLDSVNIGWCIRCPKTPWRGEGILKLGRFMMLLYKKSSFRSLLKPSRLSNRYLLQSDVSIQLLRQWLWSFLAELSWTQGNFVVLSCWGIFLHERDNFSKSNLFVFFLNPLITFSTVYESSVVLAAKSSDTLSKISSLSYSRPILATLPTTVYLPFQSHFVGCLHRDSGTWHGEELQFRHLLLIRWLLRFSSWHGPANPRKLYLLFCMGFSLDKCISLLSDVFHLFHFDSFLRNFCRTLLTCRWCF